MTIIVVPVHIRVSRMSYLCVPENCRLAEEKNRELRVLFVVDGKTSEQDKKIGNIPSEILPPCLQAGKDIQVIYLGEELGQHHAIREGLRQVVEYLEKRKTSKDTVMICDLDRLCCVLRESGEIRRLVMDGSIVVGLDKNKKRGLAREVGARIFYAILYGLLRLSSPVDKTGMKDVIRNLRHITTFTAFRSDVARHIAPFLNSFDIYLFCLLLATTLPDKGRTAQRTIFFHLPPQFLRHQRSSYSYFKLLILAVRAITDAIRLIRISRTPGTDHGITNSCGSDGTPPIPSLSS